MSTRGAIARVTGDGFEGRYHHWDSYPTGLGKTLWEKYHGEFESDLERMLQALIDEHPSGWSTINEEYDCYCHTKGSEPEQLVTHEDAQACGCEYVYAFDTPSRTMAVLSSYRRNGDKMIGMFGMGDKEAVWKAIAIVQLDGPEPDWQRLDQY